MMSTSKIQKVSETLGLYFDKKQIFCHICKNRRSFNGTENRWGGALCVQMDFTWTFETTTKCNNKNHF